MTWDLKLCNSWMVSLLEINLHLDLREICSSTVGSGTFMAAAIACVVYHALVCAATALGADASDLLLPGQSISGGRTLVSPGRTFTLGLFSPGESNRRYIGLWRSDVPERVLWVANRRDPISNATSDGGSLRLTPEGRLIISNGSADIWSTTGADDTSPVAKLTDNGNLVVIDQRDNQTYLWQSFEHPTDTMLPEMKIGVNLRTGISTNLTSWRSRDDPAPGDYTLAIDAGGVPQLVLYRGSSWKWRIGPWTGEYWSGSADTTRLPQQLQFNLSISQDEVSYSSHIATNAFYSYIVVNGSTGGVVRWLWTTDGAQTWPRPERRYCSIYRQCRAYSICEEEGEAGKFECKCMQGLEATSSSSGGADVGECSRATRVKGCRDEASSSFESFSALVLPDTKRATVDRDMSPEDCRAKCARNCSCTAYANAGGCVRWFDDLVDMRTSAINGSPKLYVRVAVAEDAGNRKKISTTTIVMIVVCAVLEIAITIAVCFLCRSFAGRRRERHSNGEGSGSDGEELDVPNLDFDSVAAATGNFSVENKLGQGGFGPVYKGTLSDGQAVAVKRLSRLSSQGRNEFKNEVQLIAKLQHRNLVRLIACCIRGNERMLIYEYMPNKSLDCFLFDESKAGTLGWEARYKIIVGVARGILYLHHDSSIRIIHRDLKASNVLLDADMNPKISDFGTARICAGAEDDESSTGRVIGTFGYMSPEYASTGVFSAKSDVFSFGVLVLEIASGKKNTSPLHDLGSTQNLTGQAWTLWNEGRITDLMDLVIKNSLTTGYEAWKKCVKIGLLCVQDLPDDRPSMSTVVMTLMGNETAESLPEPRKPGNTSMMSPPRNALYLFSEGVLSTIVMEGR